MNAWIGSISALLGIMLGGLISWLITRQQLRHQELRERNKTVLSKLEELHQLLGDYAISLFAIISVQIESEADQLRSLLKNTFPKVQLPDRPEREKKNVMSLDRISLLVGAYAPDLNGHLDNLVAVTGEFSQASRELTVAKLRSQQTGKSESYERLVDRFGAIDRICTEMQVEVINITKKYL